MIHIWIIEKKTGLFRGRMPREVFVPGWVVAVPPNGEVVAYDFYILRSHFSDAPLSNKTSLLDDFGFFEDEADQPVIPAIGKTELSSVLVKPSLIPTNGKRTVSDGVDFSQR